MELILNFGCLAVRFAKHRSNIIFDTFAIMTYSKHLTRLFVNNVSSIDPVLRISDNSSKIEPCSINCAVSRSTLGIKSIAYNISSPFDFALYLEYVLPSSRTKSSVVYPIDASQWSFKSCRNRS